MNTTIGLPDGKMKYQRPTQIFKGTRVKVKCQCGMHRKQHHRCAKICQLLKEIGDIILSASNVSFEIHQEQVEIKST